MRKGEFCLCRVLGGMHLFRSFYPIIFYRFGPYFMEPVVAGLDPLTSEPHIAAMDFIGCISDPEDFVVTGTADLSVNGMAETVWEKNMVKIAIFVLV